MKVALSGYYGFGNVGDEALLAGLSAGLSSAGFEPLVLSNDPTATRALHGVAARHRVGGLPLALLECGALISGGGGLLQDKTSSRSLAYYLSVIRAARAAGRRVVVYGQSVGPLSAEGRRKVARTLAGLPLAVRDEASRELLAELGLNSELVADPALLLEAPRRTVPVSDRVVLLPRAGHPELTEGLVGLGRHFAAAGRRVEAVALHPAEDETECRRLAAALPGLPYRRLGDHQEALRLFGDAGLVVSARLHGLILAAVSRTAAVGLVYDPKVAGFLQSTGGAGFAAPIDERALLEAACEARPLPEERRQLLLDRARSGIEWLERTLRSSSLP